jgi:NADP-dependent 3-hydroxy acid dehydrogenase YdfG
MNLPTFENQVVLVTGGSSGIGRATVLAFASRGASVVFASRGIEAGMSLQTEVNQAGGKALYVQADMAKPADIAALTATTIQQYGRIDHAVNNAAANVMLTPTDKLAELDVDYTLDVNLKGVWLCMKYQLQQMVQQGSGTIVNVASINGLSGTPIGSLYTASWYTDAPKANDKTFADNLLECLPQQGLLIFDLGFFKFGWFDAFTNAEKFFVTRLREKTAYSVTRCLSQGLYFRDELINLGQYRSNPCQHPLRLVSVLWGDTWYYYLTNVLDPQQLSAQQVCELYRCRWRVEEAFLLTKRLLGLAYLWVGDTNGVQIQI